MTQVPGTPDIPGGTRQQRAAQLKAEMETQTATAEPAGGPSSRTVAQGETLDGIAAEYGMSPEEIWEHPLNEEVRGRRGSPEALQPGDTLHIPGQTQQELQPVGQGDHVVRDGDCMASIAKTSGHFWETIWNDQANAELKQVRQDPNVLLPEDRVTIPAIRKKQEPGETEMRHRFVRRGEPAALNLRLCVEDEPVANESYVLVIDGDEQNAIRETTDPDGNIVTTPIPGNARRVEVRVGEGENQLTYEVDLGHVDPGQGIEGAQHRLANLGFDVPDTGKLDYTTREALREFQSAVQIPVTGELDPTTADKLREAHGC